MAQPASKAAAPTTIPASAEPSGPGDGRGVARWAPLIGVALVAIAAYWTSLDHGFAYDDAGIIANDERLDDLAFGLEAWIAPWWPEGSAAPASRPLTTFSFWAQVQFHGRVAWAFHLFNIVAYALLCAAVASLARRWIGTAGAAWVAGLLFAVHPLHVEVVANVVGRAEILAALFAVLAVDLYLRWRPELSWRRSIAIGAVILLAGLSKEHGYFAAPIIAVLEFARRNADRTPLLARPLPIKLAVVIALVGALAVAQRVGMTINVDEEQGTVSEMDNPLFFATPAERWVTPLKLIGKATALWVAPVDQSPDYSPSMLMPTADLDDPLVVLGLGVLLGWVALTLAAWRRRWLVLGPLLIVPIAWFIPSNAVFLIGTIFGERLLTMLTIAAALLAAHAVVPLRGRPRLAGGFAVAAGLYVVLYGAYAWWAWDSYRVAPDAPHGTFLDTQLTAGLAVIALALGGAAWAWRRWAPASAPMVLGGTVALTLALGVGTVFYSGVWKDQQTLAVTTVARHPTSGRFQGFFATDLMHLAVINEEENPAAADHLMQNAVHHARLALEYWPRQDAPYVVLAVEAHRRGDRPAALRYAQYARRAAPTEELGRWVHEYIGAAPQKPELIDRREALEARREADPTDRALALELAEVHAELGEYEESIEVYETLYEPTTKDVRVLNGFTNALIDGGEHDRLLEVYANWVKAEPSNWAVLTDAAIVRMSAGEADETARRWLDRAVEVSGGAPEPFAGLGQWHERRGEAEAARQMYRRAWEIAPPTDPKRAQYRWMMDHVRG